jgi:hypothetical protein
LFGDRSHRSRVYHLSRNEQLPTFRLGAVVCARRSTLLGSIEKQERAGTDGPAKVLGMTRASEGPPGQPRASRIDAPIPRAAPMAPLFPMKEISNDQCANPAKRGARGGA